MTEEAELIEHHFAQHKNCDFKITENDTNLDFLMSEHTRLSQLEPDDYTFKSPATYCYIDYHAVSLHSHNVVTLTNLTNAPNSFFKGGFFLCRTVTNSIKIRSLLTVVQTPDPIMKNRGALLSIGNYTHPLHEKNGSHLPILSPGIILAVKNPIFFRASTDVVHAVKSDNPADIVILDEQKFNQLFPELKWPFGEIQNEENYLVMRPLWNWWKAVKDWKAIAHLRMTKKNYVGALEAYSSALDYNPRDIEVLTLRSELYLDLKIYRKCLEDSETILEIDNVHKKAVCHKAMSMIGLGQYSTAITFLEWHIQKCRPLIDSWRKAELIEILLKANTWNKQEKFGKYDLVNMLQCPSTFIHDCADYIGNVAQQNIQRKGRGVVATADIKCGELLIATKAFAMAYPSDTDSKQTCIHNLETNEFRPCAHLKLVASIAHRLIADPPLGEELYKLYDGTDRFVSKQVQDVTDYNHVDMKRIAAICDFNSFAGDTETARHGAGGTTQGLWPVVSYFNHSCYDANCRWIACGNVMFIRACKKIKKHEEITLCYISCITPYPERLFLLSQYGFACECTLCILDANDTESVHIRRQEILNEIRKHLKSGTHHQRSLIKGLIKELRDQRLDYPELNVCLQQPLLKLAVNYLKRRKYLSAATILLALHDSVFETIMNTVATQSCCYTMVCYMNCMKIEEAKTLIIPLKANLIQKHGTDSKEILHYEMRKYVSKDLAQRMVQLGIIY